MRKSFNLIAYMIICRDKQMLHNSDAFSSHHHVYQLVAEVQRGGQKYLRKDVHKPNPPACQVKRLSP